MDVALNAAVAGTAGHVVLTVVGDGDAPTAARAVPDGMAVLVADRPDAVAGYDAVVADPDRLVTARYGVEHGGRAVLRPDGYLGLVAGPDADIDAYFALLRG